MKLSAFSGINLATLAVAGLMSLSSCSDETNGLKYWDISGDGPSTEIVPLKPRYIWVDASSNSQDFFTDKSTIARDLALAKEAGFSDIVVDVRSTTGDILYKSSHCQLVESFNAWPITGGAKQTYYYDGSWDYLQEFINEGHKLGLRIHAGFNTMTGGTTNGGAITGGASLNPAGILFRDPAKREWATYRYNNGVPTNALDLPGESEKFFNPAHPEVQEYLCNLLKDLAKYDIDGIVLDRGRYNDLYSDFSDLSRKQFEEYIGSKVTNWPADILPEGSTNAVLGSKYTQYTKLWLEYRAKVIYEFMEKAREAVKSVNPDIMFGVYVGAWYNSYYNTGVNWASKRYNAVANHSWATAKFSQYGYAALMDHILLGAYANPKAVTGTGEWSMQGFCSQGKVKIGNDCPLVVGGPDVDWRWTGTNPTYTKDEILSAITNSVAACANACDGYFLFDMIHLKIDPEKWDAISEGNNKYIEDWEKRYGDNK